MEELNNEVSNVEQQVSLSLNANDTIQIAIQGPLYNSPSIRAALGEPTFHTFPYNTWRVESEQVQVLFTWAKGSVFFHI